jgi:asparagine synthase (glutamine-hydrolysing)
MTRLLQHRGPDEDGFHIKGNAGLGHRRLSIIDLSGGQQPISNEDGTLHVICNGEIYNYRPLMDELKAKGHIFKTRSDTEVILHLYEEYKEDCLNKLWGMFAFAIWDEKNQQMFLARDRAGKKPLYYAHTNDMFLFASELKSLLADPGVKRIVDEKAIHDYLTYQYVPAPATIFKGIKKLPPGCYILFTQGNIKCYRYWHLNYEPKVNISFEEAKEQTLEILEDAVKIRLESEVPLGVFLSGGVDSSAVVAFMRRHITGDLKTFSIGFEEEEFNELPYARQVAELFDTKHHEFVVRPDAIATLPKLVWHFDEPYADSSALPSYYVSEMARKYVTVALNGDGGDESFCGYTRYCGFRPFQMYGRIPESIRHAILRPFSRAMFKFLPNSVFFEKLFYVNDVSLMDWKRRYAQMMMIFRDYMKPLMYGERMQGVLKKKDSIKVMLRYMNNKKVRQSIDKMTYSDIMTYLPGDLLPKMDRATMAHALEGRSPFLDHRVMEFAASLPGDIRFKDNTLKYLLKEALSTELPHDILWRQKKGFGVPIGHWFKNELFDLARETLLSPQAVKRGLFKKAYISKILKDHQKGRQNHHHRIWALLNLEVFFRTFVDRKDISDGPITL